MRWLKHAFAVDDDGPAEPTEQERPAVEWVCRQVARRHLTTPGLIALEMSRPLNWISAQTMHFFAPAVSAIASQLTYEHYRRFAGYLERRGSVEWMARRIEEMEEDYRREEKKHEKDEQM